MKKISVFDGVKLIIVNITDDYFTDSKEIEEKKEFFWSNV